MANDAFDMNTEQESTYVLLYFKIWQTQAKLYLEYDISIIDTHKNTRKWHPFNYVAHLIAIVDLIIAKATIKCVWEEIKTISFRHEYVG